MKSNAWKWILGGAGVLLLLSQGNRYRVMNDLSKIRLGEFFTLDEFTKTSTGFDNIPPPTVVERLKKLVVNFFDPLRRALGLPITITSGYRSSEVNEAVPGSSSTSQHPLGEAGDFKVLFPGKSKAEVLAIIAPKGYTERNIEWDPVKKAYKLTNQTIIDKVRQMRLPYDQLIDEKRGESLWVHASHKFSGTQRTAWLTRRDPGPTRPREYELIKTGYA